MKFSSDPNSRLNLLRIAHMEALEMLRTANKERSPYRGKALANYKKARLDLKYFVEGRERPKKHAIDFSVTIGGIPAGISLLSYTGAKPLKQYTFPGAGPGDYEPPEEAEATFVVTDRHGYEAKWLRRKANESRLEQEVINLVEKGNGE